jgi:hypothetical protein
MNTRWQRRKLLTTSTPCAPRRRSLLCPCDPTSLHMPTARTPQGQCRPRRPPPSLPPPLSPASLSPAAAAVEPSLGHTHRKAEELRFVNVPKRVRWGHPVGGIFGRTRKVHSCSITGISCIAVIKSAILHGTVCFYNRQDRRVVSRMALCVEMLSLEWKT